MEQVDEEGKKYLNYKSISGMDLVPRMREPTPPKKQAKDDPHKFDTNPSCDCCSKKGRGINSRHGNSNRTPLVTNQMHYLSKNINSFLTLAPNCLSQKFLLKFLLLYVVLILVISC